jgi:uncharacterized protein (DUF849 family)
VSTPCIITVAITGSLPGDDGSPTSSPERFGRVLERIRKHCPGTITQVSTGGRSGAALKRLCRTGLEDNVRMDRERLAPSHAGLVPRTAEICEEHGRRPATAAEARRLLGLAGS